MSEFKAKMHKIRFPLGLCPKSRSGTLQRSPDPLAVFKGPSSKGGGGSAYSKRVPRTNCALRIKKCAPQISSGI